MREELFQEAILRIADAIERQAAAVERRNVLLEALNKDAERHHRELEGQLRGICESQDADREDDDAK